jgi:signal transduction histidine kinase/CHASE2 domain-containing sensor protein
MALWWTPPLPELNRRIADSWFRLGSESSTGDVVLVLIDDKSLERYGRWPWSRATVARLVDKIAAQEPRVIGLDILFSEQESEVTDNALADSIRRAGNVVLVDKISTGAERLWVEPLSQFAQAAVAKGHAQALLDPDGICRRFPLAELSLDGPRLAFGIEVAKQANAKATSAFIAYNEKQAGQKLVGTHGGMETVSPIVSLIAFRRAPSYPSLSAADLLDDGLGLSLRGKVVMLGFGSGDLHDRLVTPVSGAVPSPGVEIHAQIVDGILAGRFLSPVAIWLQVLVLAAISFFVVVAGVKYHPARAIIVAIAAGVFAYGIGYVAFAGFGKILDAGSVICAALLAVPIVQLEKLIRVENSVSQQLRALGSNLQSGHASRAADDVHWKLQTLEQLQNQLSSMYRFEHALLETTQDRIAVFSHSGAMLFCNTAFRELWDRVRPGSEVTLQSFIAWAERDGTRIDAEPERLPFTAECLRDGNLWNIRLTHVDQGSGASGSIMLMMGDLQARMERDRSRAEALAFATHELRTPLVAIQGLAELMARFPDKVKSTDAPEVIFRESRRLVALINSYLDVLRLDSGARPLQREPQDANGIVRHVVKVLQPLADSNRTTLRLVESTDSPLVVCDGALLTGALMNLASNAIKYGGADCEVSIAVRTSGSDLVYSVWNSGRAIPADEIDHLFDPYFRGSADRDQKPGWGLGLAFVKRMVDQHKGRILVQSSEDKGTEFQILLPGALYVASKEVGAS